MEQSSRSIKFLYVFTIAIVFAALVWQLAIIPTSHLPFCLFPIGISAATGLVLSIITQNRPRTSKWLDLIDPFYKMGYNPEKISTILDVYC